MVRWGRQHVPERAGQGHMERLLGRAQGTGSRRAWKRTQRLRKSNVIAPTGNINA